MPASSSPPPTRRPLLPLLALLALVALVLWLRRSPAPAPAGTTTLTHEAASPPPVLEADSPAPAPTPIAEKPPASPVIDEVKLEKQEVCEGEENLVSIKAHTVDGHDRDLRYVVPGFPEGNPVAIRVWLSPDGTPAIPNLRVFGAASSVADTTIPPFKVKRCAPEPQLDVSLGILTNTVADYEIFARLTDPGAGAPEKAFRPVKYSWDFGDGASETTNGSVVRHSYEGRPQETRFSYFLITARATDARGKVIVGRRGLQLRNAAYEALTETGTIKLFTSYTPRFPEPDREGNVTQRIRLWHTRPEPVPVRDVVVERLGKEGRALGRDLLPAVDVLGGTMVPPGRGLELTITLPASEPANAVGYDVTGEAAGGLRVSGHFGLVRPPPPPTAASHTPIDDPLLEAKIRKSQELLGKQMVTGEELVRLEREGAFASLTLPAPDPSAPPRVPSSPPARSAGPR